MFNRLLKAARKADERARRSNYLPPTQKISRIAADATILVRILMRSRKRGRIYAERYDVFFAMADEPLLKMRPMAQFFPVCRETRWSSLRIGAL
jgi:hypothetical protein